MTTNDKDRHVQREWEESHLRAPFFLNGSIYALYYLASRGRLYKFALDAEGKPEKLVRIDTNLPIVSDHNYIATCLFNGRVYLFGAKDISNWRYNVVVASTVNPEQSNEWSPAREITNVWGNFAEWYGKRPDCLHAAVLGDRIYLFVWRSESKEKETIWYSSSADGGVWEEPRQLTETEYNPFFAVTHGYRLGQPVLCLAGTRKSERGDRASLQISYIKGPQEVDLEVHSLAMTSNGAKWDEPISLICGSVSNYAQGNLLQIFFNGTRSNNLRRIGLFIDNPRNSNVTGYWADTDIESRSVDNHRYCDVVVAAVPVGQHDFRQHLVVMTRRMAARPMLTVSSYPSDYFQCVHRQPEQRVDDVRAWTLLGTVEGVPPFTRNGSDPNRTTSEVSYGISSSQQVTIKQTTETSVSFSVGTPAKAASPVSLNFGVKNIFSVANSMSETQELGFDITWRNSDLNSDGQYGFLLFSRPVLEGRRYLRKSHDGKTELGNFLIVRTLDSEKVFRPYPLEDPARDEPHFEGIRRRPPSSDLKGWRSEFPRYDEKLISFRPLDVVQVSIGGEKRPRLTLTETHTRATNNKAEVSLEAGVAEKLFGVKLGASFSYTHDLDVTISFSQHITAWLALPQGSGRDEVESITNLEVKPAWYLPARGALLSSETPRPHWIPQVYVARGLIPWCLSWQVIEPK